jgi:heme-degrading monooxygenase HmoA
MVATLPRLVGIDLKGLLHRLSPERVSQTMGHIRFDAPMLSWPWQLSGGRMIGVLTHHWAKVDGIDEAKKLLDRNGEAQSKAPGFVSRQTLIALADPAKITTLVVWTTNDIYDAWRASPERAAAMTGAGGLWTKPPESERFQVVG